MRGQLVGVVHIRSHVLIELSGLHGVLSKYIDEPAVLPPPLIFTA